jgi:protocatechuate 3,4-dioxygenase beta subunit
VVDEQGQPIAGAKVEIWGHLGEKKEPHELAYHVDATTDNQGQWRCRSFRKMSWSHLYISHPDFLADTNQTPRVHGRISPDREPAASEQPMQALCDFTDVQVMKKGIRVEGWVADTAGKPVHGAEIGWIVMDRGATSWNEIIDR